MDGLFTAVAAGLLGLMSEILAAILGIVLGALLTPFVASLEWLGWTAYRRFGPRPTANSLFDINFVNEQGQNCYHKNDDPQLRAEQLSWFSVRLHFKLRSKDHVILTNIALRYPELDAWPGEQSITLDGQTQATDNSDSLNHHWPLASGHVVDVRLWRKFLCSAEHSWKGDYRQVQVIIEFTARRGHGFQRLLLEGRLAAGGQLLEQRLRLIDNHQS